MNLLDFDPSPPILVLITLHSKVYSSITSTENLPVTSSFEDRTTKLPLVKATTFAHALKTTTPSIVHFLRSLDAICLNHIFFSNPEIFQSPGTAIRSYQATSSIVWNSSTPFPWQGSEDARRLPIHTIPSPSHLSEQLEMMKLRGHVDTILVEMAVEVNQLDRGATPLHGMNGNEEQKEESMLEDGSSGGIELDFRGLARECLRVLQRMGEEPRMG
ncbi:hypothetical protein B0T21DRAFT_4460 [Apiosordaria backusii]|uniref:Uncharacterized protein n=1 Tax=Apiosordaria backusii TaxID=314023 RepID=A0AA40EXL3_9PEZI|nr:hypothetical protein B0T21DRAFT_4460 [Apiosordaria backusii]